MHEQEVLGRTVGFEGLVFDGFDHRHVRTMPENTHVVRTIGVLDWGWYPDPGVLQIMSLDADGNIWLRAEWAETKTPIIAPGQRDWLGLCTKAAEHYGARSFVADPSEPEHIATLRRGDASSARNTPRRRGVTVSKAKNALQPGIDQVSALISAGRFLVDPSCENSLSEVRTWAWKTMGRDDLPQQRPEAGNDHSMDCWRYGVLELMRPGVQWSSKPAGW